MKRTFKTLLRLSLAVLAMNLACSSEDADAGDGTETVQSAVTFDQTLHVVGRVSAGNGGIRHALRHNGVWTAFGDVEGAAGDIGLVSRVAAEVQNGELHVVAIAGTTLFHTIRNSSGGWLGFGNVNNVVGNVGPHQRVDLTSDSGKLYLCTTTLDGKIWLTSRSSHGSWTPWLDVKQATGSNPGSMLAVACEANETPLVGTEINLVAERGTDGRLFHTKRQTSGTWSTLGDVNTATGSTANFNDVDLVNDTDGLHVIGTGSFFQHHAFRFNDGSWTGFGDIAGQAGDPGQESRGAATRLDDGVYVFVTTTSPSGGLFRTRRNPSGFWTNYFSVKQDTGSADNFTDVSVAGISLPVIF